VLALAAAVGWPRGQAAAEDARPAADLGGPVLLELFTSQGCSSCPPADDLLRELAAADPDGERVVPLSFHVDYWNYIGWTDPFSSERWSRRQRGYGQAFGESRIYTPQLVIDGRVHCVGSQRGCVEREIAAAAARPARARLVIEQAAITDGELVATVRATGASADTLADALAGTVLRTALYERDLTTEVRRGENARRTLRNDFVVRQLATATALDGGTFRVRLAVDSQWSAADLGLAVFLQDTETQQVLAAARKML
jgi:hypothetical protein